MSVSYDAHKIPEIPEAAARAALREGLKFVTVICEEPAEEEGSDTGVQFNAYVDSVPRTGEGILLQDGTMCQVVRVLHKAVKDPNHHYFSVVVQVIAHRIHRKQPQT